MTQQIFWKQVECYEAILVISLPSYPTGGLNQTTPESPLWTQLALPKPIRLCVTLLFCPKAPSLQVWCVSF